MIKELTKLANHLDKKGLTREADYLDAVVRKYASTSTYHMADDNSSSIWAQSRSGWYRYDTASKDWVQVCTSGEVAADQCRDENDNSKLPKFTERTSTEAEIIEAGYQPLKK